MVEHRGKEHGVSRTVFFPHDVYNQIESSCTEDCNFSRTVVKELRKTLQSSKSDKTVRVVRN